MAEAQSTGPSGEETERRNMSCTRWRNDHVTKLEVD